jgi:hypothetical protein
LVFPVNDQNLEFDAGIAIDLDVVDLHVQRELDHDWG